MASSLIDRNYYTTEVDRAVLQAGIRQATELLSGSLEGKDIVEHEVPRPKFMPLKADSMNEEVDARVKKEETPSIIQLGLQPWE
jgi:hypothetical protein